MDRDMDDLICSAAKGSLSDLEAQRLLAWRQASPGNERYFRDLMRLLEETEAAMLDVAVVPVPDLVDFVRPRSPQLTDGHAPSRARSAMWRFWMPAGLLAAGLAATALSLALRPPPPNMHAGEFVTGPTETATAVLDDGTVVRLAPNSHLSIPGVPGTRDVTLRGQAFFAVAPMQGYPFRVRTQAGEATALGTRFEVRTADDELRLVVVEGRVALGATDGPIEVGEGEMSVLRGGTGSPPVRVPDMPSQMAWLRRFIVFQNTPLKDAALTLEREYGIEVTVTDPALSEETITGWYADRTLADLLDIVCGVLQTKCSITDDHALVGPH